MLSAVVLFSETKAPHASIGTRQYRYPFYGTSILYSRCIQKSIKKSYEIARLRADPVPADHKCTNKNHYLMDNRRTGPSEVKLNDFLARLRIPIRAFKENIRMVDSVHTEHTNADQGPGEEIFNFTWPAIKQSSRKRPDDFDYTDPGN
jgi:hypothetical protein